MHVSRRVEFIEVESRSRRPRDPYRCTGHGEFSGISPLYWRVGCLSLIADLKRAAPEQRVEPGTQVAGRIPAGGRLASMPTNSYIDELRSLFFLYWDTGAGNASSPLMSLTLCR